MNTKAFIKISGMDCASCAMNIDFALEDLKGVEEVKTHYAKAITEVKYDKSKVGTKDFLNAISQLGYEAEVVEEN